MKLSMAESDKMLQLATATLNELIGHMYPDEGTSNDTTEGATDEETTDDGTESTTGETVKEN